MNLKTFFLFFFISLISNNLWSQSKRTTKADAYFQSGEYQKAVTYYEKAYSRAKSRPEKAYIAYHLGYSYKHFNDTREAQRWLRKAVMYKYQDPKSILYLADILKVNGNYDDAVEYYANYKELVPEDPRAQIGIESCKKIPEWIKHPTRYQVSDETFINSKQSDYSPAFRKDFDEIYFTSTREGTNGNLLNTASGQYFSDIFRIDKDKKGKWSEAQALGENINTEYDEGTPSLNSKGNHLFFSRCFVKESGFGTCKIFESQRNGTVWSMAKRLKLLEDSTISVGHPALSPDGLTLYFVSDMSGGKGGKDIWKVERKSETGTWSKPINLGVPVNTPGDELFPTVRSNGTLYFSSDYHMGFGGLDVFKLEVKANGEKNVKNLGYPINSAADDFGIIFEGDKEQGYFSSTRREGSRGGDDIWSFTLPPLSFAVDGIVLNDDDDQPLIKANIMMLGSDGTSFNKKTNTEGRFKFKLKEKSDYVILARKDKFLNGKAKISTRGLKDDKTFAVEIRLSPIEKPITLPNILYDFNDWHLRPESMAALDELVETLNDNPHITIELSSHTDYRGTETKNDTLSQKRAQAVVDYLIKKEIPADRLVAKGYGEKHPKKVDTKIAKKYPFLREGTILTEKYIKKLPMDKQEIANQINRRTEFKVLTTDYGVKTNK